jgi:hypothetical protein
MTHTTTLAVTRVSRRDMMTGSRSTRAFRRVWKGANDLVVTPATPLPPPAITFSPRTTGLNIRNPKPCLNP